MPRGLLLLARDSSGSKIEVPRTANCHSLRHTAGSQWIVAGVDLLTLSRRLGARLRILHDGCLRTHADRATGACGRGARPLDRVIGPRMAPEWPHLRHPNGRGRRKILVNVGAPKGVRTPVSTLKGWRPGPLDDGGGRTSSIPRTGRSCPRTPRGRFDRARPLGISRIWCVDRARRHWRARAACRTIRGSKPGAAI